MKTNIHPTWYTDTVAACACGANFTTGSILPAISVGICSKCHPFFSGQQKFVDILGQVDRFIKKTEVAKVKQAERKKVLEARKSKADEKTKVRPSLKDLLMQARKQVTT